jgi:hypothetical protein
VLSGASTTVTSGIFAAGSAAAPSISFVGDSNTGIYSPGADTLAFTEGGVEALRIDSSGKVGIGTTSPSYALDVVGSSYVSSSSLAQYFGINAVGTAGSVANGLFAPAGSTLGFVTNLTERMRIDSNGNVGIGAVPSASYRLDIQGGNARIYAGGIGSSLEIGVGASSNQYAFLDLVGDTTYDDYGLRLIRENTGSNAISRLTHRGTGTLVISTEDLGALVLATNSIERMQVASNGNVGIGTSSPGQALDVVTPSATNVSIRVRNTVGVGDFYALSSGDIFVTAQNSGKSLLLGTLGTEQMRIDPSGNVGIGTSSPGAALDVSGNIRLSAGTPNIEFNNGGAMVYGPAANTLAFATGGGPASPIERLRIDSSGNVGIGTSVPEGLLEVSKAASGTLNGEVILQRIRSNASNVVFLDIKSRRHTAGSTWTGVGMRFQHQVDSTLMGFLEFNSTDSGQDVVLGTSNAYPILFKVNNTENARFDSSGMLLVGTSTARTTVASTYAPLVQVETTSNAQRSASCIHNSNNADGGITWLGSTRGTTVGSNTIVQANDEIGAVVFVGADGTKLVQGANIVALVDGTPGTDDMPGRLVFATTADGAVNPTERMRIGNIGYLKVSNTGVYTDTGGGARVATTSHFFRSDQNAPTILITNTNTSSAVEGFTSDFPTGATGNHFIGANALARVFIVAANGNVTNTNNSYGAISDIKLKENIVNANSQWDDLKALQVRNYNFKEGQTHTQIGLVAQEAELVSPGLVSESPDLDVDGNELGTVTKSVNYSVLYMKAVKALQEAMERIETLEARLTAAGIE